MRKWSPLSTKTGPVSRMKVPLDEPTSRTRSRSCFTLSSACRPETKPSVGKVMLPLLASQLVVAFLEREGRPAQPPLQNLHQPQPVAGIRRAPDVGAARTHRRRGDGLEHQPLPPQAQLPAHRQLALLAQAHEDAVGASHVLHRQPPAREEEPGLHGHDEGVIRQRPGLPGGRR